MQVDVVAYLNGAFVRTDELAVSAFDRGFLFGHAAYEVTAVYGGGLVDWSGHGARLVRTLAGLEIPLPSDIAALETLHLELAERNGMDEGLIYLQVTAGDYGGRDFAGPEDFSPNIVLFTVPKSLIGEEARDGIAAVSVDDTRWKRRDFKTTQLLSQALAYREARRRGAQTALMVEDGFVTEAASANVWIVDKDGQLITRQLSPAILAGITRNTAISALNEIGTSVEERPFALDDVRAARESFTTSAGALIAPLVALDGVPIGSGKPGPVTRQIQRHYYTQMGADVETVAPWALE
ncbi:MAG: aminotransferase class IV [Pseudomonadota bacterium]